MWWFLLAAISSDFVNSLLSVTAGKIKDDNPGLSIGLAVLALVMRVVTHAAYAGFFVLLLTHWGLI